MFVSSAPPREGDIYKVITIPPHTFVLKYGYYAEHERKSCPPVVIFPDLQEKPVFSREGWPLVTQIQDSCCHYVSADPVGEGWCGDCLHFYGEHREIGICRCERRKGGSIK